MSNKIVFALVGILFIVMIGLTGGLFMIWNKLSATEAQANVAGSPNGQGQEMQKTPGTIFPLETFIVNLADEGGKRYLRITMDLELSQGAVADDIKKRLPQVRDSSIL